MAIIDPVCSVSNIRQSVELLCWKGVAEPNGELLIARSDYNTRIDELTEAKSAILWDLANVSRTHHWTASLYLGATTFQDFGDKRLYKLIDDIKFLLDKNLYISVFDYTQPEPEEHEVNKLVVIGPIKWLPMITEPNGFKTSMFMTNVKYAQSGYL